MRIAFDVKGTIEGPYQDQVLRLFRALEAQGHEMFVWSSLFSYATAAVAKHGLNASAQSKTEKCSCESESEYMDLAIDDERQTYLAAKRLILVHELPDDIETFALSLNPTATPSSIEAVDHGK